MFATLTTRINGHKCVIRPASVEEKWEFFESTVRNFGVEPDVSQAAVGYFVDEEGNALSDDVPYFLRGTVLNVTANVILGVLVEKAKHAADELTYHAERCDNEEGDCKDHDARIESWENYLNRRFVVRRGHNREMADRIRTLRAKRERRVMQSIIHCNICGEGPLTCDTHSRALSLTR